MIGWVGQLKKLKRDKEKIIERVKKNIEQEFSVSQEQIIAWKDSIEFLEKNLSEKYDEIYLAMEYSIPRLNRKRPDILLFFEKEIVVLEFKMKTLPKEADILQLIGYCENIRKYHKETWKKSYTIKGYLVLTKSFDESIKRKFKIEILSNLNFKKLCFKQNFMDKESVRVWLTSEYEPLPDIITGAIEIFKKRRLPQIKSIEDSVLKGTKDKIKEILDNNLSNKQLIIIAGVPGAGKTLLGLQINYEYNELQKKAIYLSGNGPLITILKKELKNEATITGILTYTKEYSQKNRYPQEEIIIFDEAQRAWDKSKYGDISEVEALLKIGNKIYLEKNKITIIALIGFGQEIYKGEEKGINLWIEELKKEEYKDWKVYCPQQLEKIFYRENNYFVKELFFDTSIRNDFIDITNFKNYLLKFQITKEIKEKLKEELKNLYEQGYQLYITRELQHVLKALSRKEKDIRLIGSSGIDDKRYQEIFQKFMRSFLRGDNDIYSWYKNRDENIIATEFVVQGLDIDFPIVIFGGDYVIKNKKWIITNLMKSDKKNIFRTKNEKILARNIYNVLLTRGRKGMLLYLDKSILQLDELYQLFKEIGVIDL